MFLYEVEEKLVVHMFCNHKGLLMKYVVTLPNSLLGRNLLKQKIGLNSQHTIIVNFIKSKVLQNHIMDWVAFLDKQIKVEVIHFKFEIGHGFYYLIASIFVAIKFFFHIYSSKNTMGKTIYQKWVPFFNVDMSIGFKFLVWITF